MRLSDVTKNIEGELISDGEFSLIAFCSSNLEEHFLSFIENIKYIEEIERNGNISCIICTSEMVSSIPKHVKGIFVSNEPKCTLFKIHNMLTGNIKYMGEQQKTAIGKNCTISKLACISEKNITIGDNVVIEEFVSIKGRVKIGDNCIIRAGSIIGGKGFSFARDREDKLIGLVDCGSIELEDNVEIFELVQISTPPFIWEKTLIKMGTKVDAQALIGHGSIIGKNTLITEGSRICGNANIGDNCWLGVGAIVKNRGKIGNDVRVSIGSVVTKEVKPGETVSGNFAIEHNKFINFIKSIR